MNFVNRAGQKYGKLTVKEIDYSRCSKDGFYWLCDCDCGTKNFSIKSYDLVKRKCPNCGCETDRLRYESRHKENKYDLTHEYGIGYTDNGTPFYFDLEDYDKVKKYRWSENRNHKDKTKIYIETVIPKFYDTENYGKRILLHKLIMGIPFDNSVRIDHINKNRLDCRKSNLRLATHQQNNYNRGLDNRNKTGVSGVFYDINHNIYRSYISYNYKRINIGSYKNFEDAIKARLIKEKEYFGEFAPQQGLYEKYNIKDDGIMPESKKSHR